MDERWHDRFRELIDDDGRPYRVISEAAEGVGINYVEQAVKKTNLRVNQLLSVLKVLGPGSDIYVFTGIRLTRDEVDFLENLLEIDPAKHRNLLKFAQEVARPAAPPTSSPSDQGASPSKGETSL